LKHPNTFEADSVQEGDKECPPGTQRRVKNLPHKNKKTAKDYQIQQMNKGLFLKNF
jgi:hypothetical protein